MILFVCGNGNGNYAVFYPDLPGCVSEGKNIGNAMYMAQRALNQWIEYLSDKGDPIPAASPLTEVITEDGEFASYICVEIKDNRAVRRTVSLPKWMDEKAIAQGLSLSKVLQEALAAKIGGSYITK